MDDMPKVLAGTAQLTMDYGIANKTGIPSDFTIQKMSKVLNNYGVKCFDTAIAYKNDLAINQFIDKNKRSEYRIFTKIDCNSLRDYDTLILSLKRSLKNIGVERFYCLYLHDPEINLYWNAELDNKLKKIILDGVTEYCGISVYEPEQLDFAIHIDAMKFIQAPFNILDRRFINKGIHDEAAKNNKKIVFRSIFLQGLLLLSDAELKIKVPLASDYIKKINEICKKYSVLPLDACIQYALFKTSDIPLIIGAENETQLESNLEKIKNGTINYDLVERLDREFKLCPNEEIINPAKWM